MHPAVSLVKASHTVLPVLVCVLVCANLCVCVRARTRSSVCTCISEVITSVYEHSNKHICMMTHTSHGCVCEREGEGIYWCF